MQVFRLVCFDGLDKFGFDMDNFGILLYAK